MKRILATGAALALLVSAPTSRAAPGDVIVKPDWARRPDAAYVGRVYPEAAARAGVAGSAKVECAVSIRGALEQCSLLSEGPPGWGLGAAALAMTRLFSWRPETVNGVPVGGAPVVIRVDFGWSSGEYGAVVVTDYRSGGAFGTPPYRLAEPIWSKTPTPAQLAAAFPSSEIGKADGYVILRCKVKPDGSLTLCNALLNGSEDGEFRPAALKLADDFTLSVTDYDPSDLRRASVDIPVTFVASGKPTPKIAAPHWIRAPDAATLAAIFPSEARAANVSSGVGVVKCRATHEGRLADCHLVSEDPAALGFGQAALKAADSIAMNPWTADGGPVDEAIFEIPIKLKLPGSKP